MAEGPPPVDLIRRIEAALEGEPPDKIIFAMGLVLGNVIAVFAEEADHEEVVEACLTAIQLGIKGEPTEH